MALSLLWMLSRSRARADVDSDVSRARIHYEAGEKYYRGGSYQDAIREFLAGYELAPRPRFLLNLGQAYRQVHDLPRAIKMYERFLVATSSDEAEHKSVASLVAELRVELSLTRARGEPSAASTPADTT